MQLIKASFDTEQNAVSRYDFPDGTYNAPDPAVIAQIISTAISIINFFKKKKQPGDKLGDWIIELGEAIKAVEEAIESIKEELKSLKVFIREAHIKDAEVTLFASLKTYRQHVTLLRENPRDERVIDSLRNLYLTEISVSANKLMEYGYVHVHTIGFTLVTIKEILDVLGFDRASKKTVITDYKHYFNKCIATDIQGSIADVLLATNQTKKDLEYKYRGGQGSAGINYKANCRYSKSEPREPGYWRCEIWSARIDYELAGTFLTGFKIEKLEASNSRYMKTLEGDILGNYSSLENQLTGYRASLNNYIEEASRNVEIYKGLIQSATFLEECKKLGQQLVLECDDLIAKLSD
jgi:hypothetical protein